MFKNNVIENKKKKDFLKKQRLNVIDLRNKFLAEWASNILELNDKEKLIYIEKVTNAYFQKQENKFIIKKIEDDFASRKINISFKEYPELSFRKVFKPFHISPFGNTTSKPKQQSFAVPYFKTDKPPALVAKRPPKDAESLEEKSNGK